MAQYAGLMVLLLAFFIVLVSLSQVQQGGFKSGIGEIKNAFGMSGGYGFFNYAFFGRTGGNAPNPNDAEDGEIGFDKVLLQGLGGPGDTDLDVKESSKSGFVRFRFNFEFPKGSDKLTADMEEELKKIGLGFTLFDNKVQIRCFCSESQDASANRFLALSRAMRIMRALVEAGVPPYKLDCVGYGDQRYLLASKPVPGQGDQASTPAGPSAASLPSEQKTEAPETQGAYFYVFVKDLSALDAKQ